MKSKKWVLVAAMLCLLSGCIYIKSDYQSVNRYKLSQSAVAPSTEKRNATLMVQTALVNGEFDSEYLLYTTDDSHIQRYFYHRWMSEPAEMATEMLSDRFLRSGAFSGGVVQAGSFALPTHILETRILEMIAHTAENSGENFVSLRIQATLLARKAHQDDKNILLQKTYSRQIRRKDNLPASIPVAMSTAFHNISDEMLTDILQSLK